MRRNRATHNLYILLEEAEWLDTQMAKGVYDQNFRSRLNNSTYLPLLEQLVQTGLNNLAHT